MTRKPSFAFPKSTTSAGPRTSSSTTSPSEACTARNRLHMPPVLHRRHPQSNRHPHRADGQHRAGGGNCGYAGKLTINILRSLKKLIRNCHSEKCVFSRLKKMKYEMAKEYPIKDTELQEVNEPQTQYIAPAHESLRILTDEELERSMTLEELDAHLTELIHQHYHNK